MNGIFVNNNLVRESEIEKWVEEDGNYFAGIKKGEKALVAFEDYPNHYYGYFTVDFEITQDKNDIKFNFKTYSYIRDMEIEHDKVDIANINHIYTKEFINKFF
jgi:hypothetical protein